MGFLCVGIVDSCMVSASSRSNDCKTNKNCHENECEDCHNDADCGPADHHPDDICVGRKDGWYPDLFNCAK